MRPKKIINLDKYVVQEHIICAKGFYTILGFGKTTYHKYKGLYEKGVQLGFYGNQGQQKPRKSTMVAWWCLQR
jgi:hypothetical protein